MFRISRFTRLFISLQSRHLLLRNTCHKLFFLCQFQTEGGGGFFEIVKHPLAVFSLLGFHALSDIKFAVLEQAVNQASQLVGCGCDSRGGPKFARIRR